MQVKSFELALRPYQLFPAIGMQSEGEEVLLRLDAVWNSDDITQMVVDCGEEDWVRLDDIRLNGTVSLCSSLLIFMAVLCLHNYII